MELLLLMAMPLIPIAIFTLYIASGHKSENMLKMA
jgi:hypothetical protein